MFKNDWPVTESDVRPARLDGTCFYCHKPLGSQHNEGCVIRNRSVVVDITFRIIKQVPEDWEPSMVEFHMNDSSSCADNLARDIFDMTEDVDGRCLCGLTTGRYVREASDADIEEFGRTPKPEEPEVPKQLPR